MNLHQFKLKIIHSFPKELRKDFYNVFSNFTNYFISPKPRHVHYEITYRCTCKCVFCSRWSYGPHRVAEELSTSEAISFFKKAIGLGIVGVSFSGGEPFIRTDIFDIASFCKDIGLFLHVSSNGTLINEKNCELINRLFDSILISVDSHIPELHDGFRGVPGTFQKAISALDLLDRTRTTAQMVVNADNIDSLFDYVSVMSRKTDRVRLQPIHQNPENMFILKEASLAGLESAQIKWESFIKRLKESGLKLYGSETYYNLFPKFLSHPASLRNRIDCFMGSHAFFLDPYGNVVPCEGIRKPFGNIRQRDLIDIWKDANKFRRTYNKKSRRPCVCMYTCLEGDIIFWERFFSLKRHPEFFPP